LRVNNSLCSALSSVDIQVWKRDGMPAVYDFPRLQSDWSGDRPRLENPLVRRDRDPHRDCQLCVVPFDRLRDAPQEGQWV
jgi:hypothetical protein